MQAIRKESQKKGNRVAFAIMQDFQSSVKAKKTWPASSLNVSMPVPFFIEHTQLEPKNKTPW